MLEMVLPAKLYRQDMPIVYTPAYGNFQQQDFLHYGFSIT